MGESLLDQDYAIRASISYNDEVTDSHLSSVAESQIYIEGDLNVLRSRMKAQTGLTNWHDSPSLSLKQVYEKYEQVEYQPSGFFDVASGTGNSSAAFDTAIKTITNHADGAGASAVEGVVLNATMNHKLMIKDADSLDAVDDGSGNQVYGRISFATNTYTLSWYSWVNGVETAYTFAASQDITLMGVLVSRMFKDRPWVRAYNPSFHDNAGVTGNVDDDNVVVDGMSGLYNGLVTQATVNAKGDDLGVADTSGQGAHLIQTDDTASGSNSYFTASSLQAIINELKTQLGGATSTTYDFATDGIVLADNDAVYAALNKLNQRHSALATADTNGSGTDLIEVNDTNSDWTGTDLTTVLEEIWAQATSGTRNRKQYETTAVIPSNTNWTLPFSMTATVDATHSAYLDVTVSGSEKYGGTIALGDDFEQVSTTQIKFLRTIPSGRNLILKSHG